MSPKHIYTQAICALVLLCAPVMAAAQGYMTPEQILQQNNDSFIVPTHIRGAQWAGNLQEQQNIERHPSIVSEPGDPQQDTVIPPPVMPPQDQGTFIPPPQQPTMTQGLDPLTARLLDRLTRMNVDQSQTGALPSTAGASGAPLASSGPAGDLAVAVMIVATAWTLHRARVLERFVLEL